MSHKKELEARLERERFTSAHWQKEAHDLLDKAIAENDQRRAIEGDLATARARVAELEAAVKRVRAEGNVMERHCPTCVCGKRAPVQPDHRGVPGGKGPGTIAWAEHEEAWAGYAREYGRGQSAARIAERGGFSHYELKVYLGRAPTTWVPLGRER